MIHHGDCLEVMAGLDAESVDAIVTDPPYGLGFMGKAWDHGAPGVPFWREMLRVAKPSSYLLAFGGTRTVHRIATSIEDAGWIIRDMLVWAYASGFPKSKASLKPAWEPIVMARKPGPLRMLAIDECRIGTDGGGTECTYFPGVCLGHGDERAQSGPTIHRDVDENGPRGRWPANVILTDPIFDGGVEGVVGGGIATTHPGKVRGGAVAIYGNDIERTPWDEGPGDSGTYSRFFLIPKSSRSDREPVMSAPGATETARTRVIAAGEAGDGGWVNPVSVAPGPLMRQNVHPTVKPTELMRHLVRLVTPTGGLVLDPFLGSGTTAIAAELEGFRWIGIEKEAEYVKIAEARLNGTQRGMGLSV